ncbi:MAG: MoxR family ATPase [Planctomycetota bacterium]|nr:MoxR family ATPase [Planctomycetota bacterium]
MSTPDDIRQQLEHFRSQFEKLRVETHKMIVGYEDTVENVLICLLSRSNALLEGVPGLGKTMLVRVLSQILQLGFVRVQFTPDLMPADIVGTNIVVEDDGGQRHMEFRRGPIFTNLMLADEINRATPKTQSALLEAMEEHEITVGGVTHILDEPFFVLATQNPVEQIGTYPLPKAALDKFMFKLIVHYPGADELMEISRRTTAVETPTLEQVMTREEILELQRLVRDVPVAPHVERYAVRLVLATDPDSEFATDLVNDYVKQGSSPRGLQALILGGKIRALLNGRFNLACEDIRSVAIPSLRHRLTFSFEGQSAGISTDKVVEQILEQTEEFVDEPALTAS